MCNKNITFIDKCLNGDVKLETIDDYISEWHDNDDERPLYDFLGLTKDEYSLWVENPQLLNYIISLRRYKMK
jgi:hypothetical protein